MFVYLLLLTLTSAQVLSLNGVWKARNANETISISAKVPGEIHTALMDSKIIGDPYFRENDYHYQWVGRDTWTYTHSFKVTWDVEGKSTFIKCEGIDTASTIYVNDIQVQTTDNQHRIYWIDVTDVVQTGNNVIVVAFDNQAEAANSRWKRYKDRASVHDQYGYAPYADVHRAYLRKAQNGFGWDWGPAFGTVGIIRDITLITTDTAIIREIVPSITLADNYWSIENKVFVMCHAHSTAYVTFKTEWGRPITQDFECGKRGEQMLTVSLPKVKESDVERWWPAGYGKQRLYWMSAEIANKKGTQMKVKTGFRTVKLVTDPIGTTEETMYWVINDVPIFLKGSNMIPMDVFETRIPNDDITYMLEQVVHGNQNTIRVWGGGIYQREWFYNECDRLGILIWQEFMFSCSLYPRDRQFLETVRMEVRDVTRRLSVHPCVIGYSGNNENSGEGQSTVSRHIDYHAVYDMTVQDELRLNDITRPYWPASPSNGYLIDDVDAGLFVQRWGNKQSDPRWGDIHRYDYTNVCTDVSKLPIPKFASEFGYHSLPSLHSLKESILPEDYDISGRIMILRNHHTDENKQIINMAKKFFISPKQEDREKKFVGWIYQSQLLSGMCVSAQAEHYRRMRVEGHTMGALYWQLNDIWHAPAWSSLEYGNYRWKMLHHMMKETFEPLLLSMFRLDNKIIVYCVNDHMHEYKDVSFIYNVLGQNGMIVRWQEKTVTCPALTSVKIAEYTYDQILGELKRNETFITYYLEKGKDLLTEERWFFPNQDFGFFKEMDIRHPFFNLDSVVQSGPKELTLKYRPTNYIAFFVDLTTDVPGYFSHNAFTARPWMWYTIKFYCRYECSAEGFDKKVKAMSYFSSFNDY